MLHNVARGAKKTRSLLTPVGVIIFGLFSSIFIVAALAVDKWLKFPVLIAYPASAYVSIPLLILGISLTAWSVIHFLRAKGTPVPANPPPNLVTSGPYAYTRNPMLTGVFIILFGAGIYFGSISLTLIFTPIYILVNRWELKEIEEPELVKRLGTEYTEYQANTPMFLPKVWKLRRED